MYTSFDTSHLDNSSCSELDNVYVNKLKGTAGKSYFLMLSKRYVLFSSSELLIEVLTSIIVNYLISKIFSTSYI